MGLCFFSSCYSFVPTSFLLPVLVVRPGAPSSVLAPSSVALVTRSDALVSNSFLFLVAMPGAPSSVLAPSSVALVTRSDALVTCSNLIASLLRS